MGGGSSKIIVRFITVADSLITNYFASINLHAIYVLTDVLTGCLYVSVVPKRRVYSSVISHLMECSKIYS